MGGSSFTGRREFKVPSIILTALPAYTSARDGIAMPPTKMHRRDKFVS
jgi:hypothetical protein